MNHNEQWSVLKSHPKRGNKIAKKCIFFIIIMFSSHRPTAEQMSLLFCDKYRSVVHAIRIQRDPISFTISSDHRADGLFAPLGHHSVTVLVYCPSSRLAKRPAHFCTIALQGKGRPSFLPLLAI